MPFFINSPINLATGNFIISAKSLTTISLAIEISLKFFSASAGFISLPLSSTFDNSCLKTSFLWALLFYDRVACFPHICRNGHPFGHLF